MDEFIGGFLGSITGMFLIGLLLTAVQARTLKKVAQSGEASAPKPSMSA